MADIYGKIIAVLPTRSGTSAKGTQWSSQTAVIETQEQYPKKLAFDVMNDKIGQFNLQVGEFLSVSYDLDAHEFNGRWYNSCKAWNVQRQQPQGQQGYQQPQQPQQGQQWGTNPQAAAQVVQNGLQQAMQSAVSNGQPVSNTPPAGESDNLPF